MRFGPKVKKVYILSFRGLAGTRALKRKILNNKRNPKRLSKFHQGYVCFPRGNVVAFNAMCVWDFMVRKYVYVVLTTPGSFRAFGSILSMVNVDSRPTVYGYILHVVGRFLCGLAAHRMS